MTRLPSRLDSKASTPESIKHWNRIDDLTKELKMSRLEVIIFAVRGLWNSLHPEPQDQPVKPTEE